MGRQALHEARVRFEQALDLLRALPEDRSALEKAVDIRLELRTVLLQLDESHKVVEHLREAERIVERLNDAGRLGRVLAFMGRAYEQLGELDQAQTFATRALEIATKLEDLELRLFAASNLVQLHFHRGDLARAIELATDVLAALPPDWVLRKVVGSPIAVSVLTRAYLILSLYGVGRFEEAAACEAETIKLAEKTEDAFSIAYIHLVAVSLYTSRGDWAKAHARVEQWLALIQTADIKHLISFALAFSAFVLARLGRADEAMSRLGEAEKVVEQQVRRGNLIHVPAVCQLLGRACVVLGRIENAQRVAQQAMEGCARRPETLPQVLLVLADIAGHPDRLDPEVSERLYREAIVVAEGQGRRPIIAHCHFGLGTLYRRTGKRKLAQEHLTAAMTMYREMDMRFYLEQAEAELHNLA